MKYTVKQIRDAAEGATFYVTPGGDWLRMQWIDRDDGSFCALDEDSGEDHKFYFDEMVDEEEDPHFERLVRTQIDTTESEVWSEP
jgi:hypothetical protein